MSTNTYDAIEDAADKRIDMNVKKHAERLRYSKNRIAVARNASSKPVTTMFIGKNYQSVLAIANNGLKRFVEGRTTKAENAALVAMLKAWHAKQSANLENVSDKIGYMEHEHNHDIKAR